jgi:orotate phosphoribosyltransferase
MTTDLMALLSARDGHFRYESGYHAALWFDLDPLFSDPAALAPLIARLANQCAQYRPEMICGPLVGGAFVALRAAEALGVEFCFTERYVNAAANGLFPVEYRLPAGLRAMAAGKRAVILDDVMSAGSAIRGSYAALIAADAEVVAVGALLVLGDTGSGFFADRGIPVEALETRANPIWAPHECPLCAAGLPLQDFTPEGVSSATPLPIPPQE